MVKHLLVAAFLLAGFFKPVQAQLPPKREFRAVWIATVENIDWPSRRGLPVEQQKQEFITLLNTQQRNGMNAVVVQVRPVADAFYASPFEPWSEYLTGTQGQAPNPYYDPLQFMIEETHKRGMEFHAWFNPYRAVFNASRNNVTANHISRMRPQWFLTYDNKKYFDPGVPEVREYVTQIIRDVVRRYDIDAVHFDDYFYPYRVPGKEFPDHASYRQYGHGMEKDDWRRYNVDTIIHMVSIAIKQEKKWVKFGISPFGIWRNKNKDPEGSYTNGGNTNYDDLYADVLKWLKNGWIDYVAPQLYWERGHRIADYELLLNWWAQHAYGRHLYIGHGVYRINSNAAWNNPNELPVQITETRTLNTVQGSIFYSAKSFNGNPRGIEDSLRNHFYHYHALRPIMPWLNFKAPQSPYFADAFERTDGLHLHWVDGDGDSTSRTNQYVLYRFEGREVINLNNPEKILTILTQTADPQYIDLAYQKGKEYTYVLTSLDRLQNESLASDPLYIRIAGGKTKFYFDPQP
ncbi:glycoside hydrolase family 10 protein [Chitinophaga sancti]|uniref:Family 10 glycosylhydrolase n=1 Tax=Chitinophaga sancti TaxID=1004 RepID=A0A1K1P2R4_9BACT|nr:family 10 glycosylhydrolase [Chitinophaga sancti]WQD60440.1 family 10 glycosylhydrolase [Chitinophaga sancti]WQG87432.1 family 10 glycosylhydrolase [Chitinophaga sancti]SFW42064.1 Uncharacterized lipoprotein YddW, UPF0748 family [Chitinophaga sancti]